MWVQSTKCAVITIRSLFRHIDKMVLRCDIVQGSDTICMVNSAYNVNANNTIFLKDFAIIFFCFGTIKETCVTIYTSDLDSSLLSEFDIVSLASLKKAISIKMIHIHLVYIILIRFRQWSYLVCTFRVYTSCSYHCQLYYPLLAHLHVFSIKLPIN